MRAFTGNRGRNTAPSARGIPQVMGLALIALVLWLNFFAERADAQQFYGDVILKPVGDGVLMEVVQSFGFVDARNRKWEVPAQYRTDGASIPMPLWSIIGSPFTGKYVPAAIVHDF